MGCFLLAEGDETRQVEGSPDLPSRYRALVLAAPVEAREISVELEKTSKDQYGCGYRYRLTLDRGTRDGLVAELELRMLAPQNVYDRAEIVATEDRTSTATLSIWPDDCAKPEKVPTLAWRLTTGAYAPGQNAQR